jgi:hypothetical protein
MQAKPSFYILLKIKSNNSIFSLLFILFMGFIVFFFRFMFSDIYSKRFI